jgi:hypothetical protein
VASELPSQSDEIQMLEADHESRNFSFRICQTGTYQEKSYLPALLASSFRFRLRGIRQQRQLLSGPTTPAD